MSNNRRPENEDNHSAKRQKARPEPLSHWEQIRSAAQAAAVKATVFERSYFAKSNYENAAQCYESAIKLNKELLQKYNHQYHPQDSINLTLWTFKYAYNLYLAGMKLKESEPLNFAGCFALLYQACEELEKLTEIKVLDQFIQYEIWRYTYQLSQITAAYLNSTIANKLQISKYQRVLANLVIFNCNALTAFHEAYSNYIEPYRDQETTTLSLLTDAENLTRLHEPLMPFDPNDLSNLFKSLIPTEFTLDVERYQQLALTHLRAIHDVNLIEDPVQFMKFYQKAFMIFAIDEVELEKLHPLKTPYHFNTEAIQGALTRLKNDVITRFFEELDKAIESGKNDLAANLIQLFTHFPDAVFSGLEVLDMFSKSSLQVKMFIDSRPEFEGFMDTVSWIKQIAPVEQLEQVKQTDPEIQWVYAEKQSNVVAEPKQDNKIEEESQNEDEKLSDEESEDEETLPVAEIQWTLFASEKSKKDDDSKKDEPSNQHSPQL